MTGAPASNRVPPVMTAVIVCPLSQIAPTVSANQASHLVSLINVGTHVPRPKAIPKANHLFIGMNDITEAQDGMILPGEAHVRELIAFAGKWDRATADRDPLLCRDQPFDGGSVRDAGAARAGARRARDRRRAPRRLADRDAERAHRRAGRRLLGRDGRMIEAVEAIGRGAEAFECMPFRLSLGA